MTNAQSLAKRPRSRKWFKVGITSFSFIAAVVGAFYFGSQHSVATIGNAPQSAVTRDAPANVSTGADDANAPVSPARAPDAQGFSAAEMRAYDDASYAAVNDMFRNSKVLSAAKLSDLHDNVKHQYEMGDLTPERIRQLIETCTASSLQVAMDHDRMPSAIPLYRPEYDRALTGCTKTVESYVDAM